MLVFTLLCIALLLLLGYSLTRDTGRHTKYARKNVRRAASSYSRDSEVVSTSDADIAEVN